MSDDGEKRGERPEPRWAAESEIERATGRGLWKYPRFGIALVTGTTVALTGLIVDLGYVFVLPVSRELASGARFDILLSCALQLALLAMVIVMRLRPLTQAMGSFRLGLRVTETERGEALRSGVEFPFFLATVAVATASVGVWISFGANWQARGVPFSLAIRLALISQCVAVVAVFPILSYARAALRPFVRRLAGEALPGPPRSRMAMRISGLILILTCVIVGLASLLSSLLLEDRDVQQRRARIARLARTVAAQMRALDADDQRDLVSTRLPRGLQLFVVEADQRIQPAHLARTIRVGSLRRPARRQVQVGRLPGGRLIAVTRGAGGRLVGVVSQERPLPWRTDLIALALVLLLIGFGLAVLLGLGLARELRAVRERIRAVASGGGAPPLPGDSGSVAEVGRLIDAINALLRGTHRERVRGFVAIEATQEATRAKTQFLAHMSHDLRSPLTAIIGFADLMVQDVDGDLLVDDKELLERILQSGVRLRTAIDELLDTARLDAGRLTLSPEWTTVATLISQAIRSAADAAHGLRRPRVKTSLEAGLPPVWIDPDRTAMALARLMEMLGEGKAQRELHLRAYRERLSDIACLTLEVTRQGDGRGSAGPSLVQVKQAFEQGLIDQAGQPRLCLGPYLAWQLTTRQGGRLEIFQEPGRAEGFRLSFAEAPDETLPGPG